MKFWTDDAFKQFYGQMSLTFLQLSDSFNLQESFDIKRAARDKALNEPDDTANIQKGVRNMPWRFLAYIFTNSLNQGNVELSTLLFTARIWLIPKHQTQNLKTVPRIIFIRWSGR